MDNAKMLAERVRDLASSNDQVVLAYLFGSVAAGRAGPLSDVDIGVLSANGDAASETVAALTDALCLALKRDDVEVVDLRAAPPPIRYRVIRSGTLLLCRDERVRQRFESDTVRQYLDFKPIRDGAFQVSRNLVLRPA
ncbi:MAG: type VII toxin-antitoxin system MntA family adenylyltransferase antitoxin [Planctomycetota bacterium]|jgi:predicted nucleotidyltransferase